MKKVLIALIAIGFLWSEEHVTACKDSPDKLKITVAGAQAGTDANYYVVQIPDTGGTPVTVTLTGVGDTPCPTDAEKCKCNGQTQMPETDGDSKYTFTKDAGTQDPTDGPTITWNVDSSVTPKEYKFKLTKIEQKYKACAQGWTGGVASKENTQASDEVTVLAYQVKTETVATSPSDQKRKKLGIGEGVNVTFKPTGLTVTWSVSGSGNGAVAPTTGTATVYTAPEKAATPELDGAFKGVTTKINFTIVTPATAYVDMTSENATASNTQLILKDKADWYVGPEDVNFTNVQIAEQTCNATASNYFDTVCHWNNLPHTPGPALSVTTTLVSGKGWKCSGTDSVESGTCPSSFSAGDFDWPIPWNYTINGNSYNFTTVHHHENMALVSSKGKLTLTKPALNSTVSEP